MTAIVLIFCDLSSFLKKRVFALSSIQMFSQFEKTFGYSVIGENHQCAMTF